MRWMTGHRRPMRYMGVTEEAKEEGPPAQHNQDDLE